MPLLGFKKRFAPAMAIAMLAACDVRVGVEWEEHGIFECTAPGKPSILVDSTRDDTYVWSGTSGMAIEAFDLNSQSVVTMHTDDDWPYECVLLEAAE